MSGERLREAAALMRERAEAAVLATGEGNWAMTGIGWNNAQGTTYSVTCTFGVTGVCEAGTEEQAEHIASWHPAVALAVADLLDRLADDREHDPYLPKHFDDAALALADAYLGSPS